MNPKVIRPTIYNHDQAGQIAQALSDEGYVVVAIPTIDVEALKRQFVADLATITGQGDLTISNMWDADTVVPTSSNPSLLGEYGLSQSDSAWMVRTDPTILRIYKQLLYGHSQGELVCSTDAVSFSTDKPIDSKLAGHMWLHVDQNLHVYGGDIDSIQGIYYAESSYGTIAGECDTAATTVVVPRSHRHWHSHQYSSKSHYQMVDRDKYGRMAVKLAIPGGSLLLFSSKTVHQGWYGQHRLCFMVCYGKRQDRNEEARRRKVMMYLSGQRSTHWSQFGQSHGNKWFWGDPYNMLSPTLKQVSDGFTNTFPEELYVREDLYQPSYDNYIPDDRLALL